MTSPHFFETRAHLLVCTGPKCARRDARRLFDSLWQRLERERIAYYAGGSVRLTESGCLGACSFGPNVCTYVKVESGSLEEAWYFEQTAESVLEIARSVQRGEPLPRARRYG